MKSPLPRLGKTMDPYKQLSNALNAKDQNECLKTIEQFPDLAQRRFLHHRRQCGQSAPLLLHAAELGMNELLSKLVSLGVDINAYGGIGATALHFAVSARDPDAARTLIAAGANVEAKDSLWGNTPLAGCPDSCFVLDFIGEMV